MVQLSASVSAMQTSNDWKIIAVYFSKCLETTSLLNSLKDDNNANLHTPLYFCFIMHRSTFLPFY